MTLIKRLSRLSTNTHYKEKIGNKKIDIFLDKVYQMASDANIIVTPSCVEGKASLLKRKDKALAPIVNTTQEVPIFLRQVDASWQNFVTRHLNPILGGVRDKQLKNLQVTITDEEKDNNRYLGLSIINSIIAFSAQFLYAPLFLLNILFMSYILYRNLFMPAYKSLFKDKRINFWVLAFIAELMTLLGGFFTAGSLILLFFSISFKISDLTQKRFQQNLTDSLNEKPLSVWLLIDNVEIEVPFSTVQVNDIVVVHAGESVPVDGVIIDGLATIDQQALTGESEPIEKSTDDAVFSNTVMLSGKINIKVNKTGKDTVSAQIISVLENTANYQLPFASKVERFADRAAPYLLGVAGFAWLALRSMAASVTILNSGVGTAARLSGPITMLNYLNIASHNGVLIKDARSLEVLKNIDTIVFDKTGTLTLEQPMVTNIYLSGNITEDELLTYAAAAEYKQSHPVARAILKEAQKRHLELPEINQADYEMGFGIRVSLNGQLVHVGSTRFMAMEDIGVSKKMKQVQISANDKGHSIIMVAFNNTLAGVIELQPTVRPEALEAIKDLKARKMDLYIISGDSEGPTRSLAKILGIKHYFADVLPQNKSALVEKLQNKGRFVCFIGDGINDAPALTQADVSISLSGATTVATDVAQIVLMNRDLRQLGFLLDIARDFDKTLQKLFLVSLLPVGVITVGVFALHISLYTGTFIWQLGIFGGLATAFSPLRKYKEKKALPNANDAEKVNE